MICTQCFQNIAPRALENSYKGEHRRQGEREGQWEFPCGAKGLEEALFPLGSSETPLLTLHAQPLRLTPGLAHFGGPCSLCICGRGGSPQPRPWRPSSVPWGGVPGEGSLSSWAAHDLWVQQSLAGTCFQNLNFCLKACLSDASESALLIFQEPCEQVASIYCAAAEHPAGQACLPLRPAPFPLWWTRYSSLPSVSHRRHWDQEVKRAQKDSHEPSLMKAIVKCYWKSYLIWGMFTFLEVKDFHTVRCFLVYVSQYWGGRDRGERDQWSKVWG